MFQLEIMSDKKNAQIMLITLLVLIVLGILLAGIVLVLRRDTEQTVANAKFEQLFNSAEANLQSVVNEVGDASEELNTLPGSFSECIADQANIEYTCTFVNSEFSSIETTTEVNIENTKEVEDYEVNKDKSFALDLNGYADTIEISWDSDVAMELTFIYETSGGDLQVITDIYDSPGVLDTPVVSHSFTFSNTTSRSFQTNLSTISGFSGTARTLILTPRTDNPLGSTRISLRAITNIPAFPYQMRVFTSASFDQADGSSPVARIITQIPLTPQIDSIFNYGLFTDSDIGL